MITMKKRINPPDSTIDKWVNELRGGGETVYIIKPCIWCSSTSCYCCPICGIHVFEHDKPCVEIDE